jgi:thiosulfate/3-mercaptopyruvate sulfurtransferase
VKRVRLVLLMVTVLFVLPFAVVLAKDLPPIVSQDWIEKNLTHPKLVAVDIRKVEEYKEGHIPGSISVFYGTWAVKRKELDNELPVGDDLFDIIGSSGIRADSWVVIVGKTDTPTDLFNQTRVAWTLAYAGIDNVGILDGSFNLWAKSKKPVSTDFAKPKAVEYKGKVNRAVFAGREYVKNQIGKAMVVDTRMPDFFFGASKPPFVTRAGHIQGANLLPSPWIFTAEGTFRSLEELEAMASGVMGRDKSKEIITYSDTGRLASGWWFVLNQVAGYSSVKNYDGSMQDWAKDPGNPMVKFSWH